METRSLESLASLASLTHRHGSLVRDLVVPAHLSLAGWYRALASGLLVRLHPGVARLATASVTPMMRIEAAIAAAMPGSSAAGLTAAWLWGAESVASDTVELLAPPYRHPGRLDGVEFHRPTSRPVPELLTVHGLRTCDPLRATLDVAAWHPELLDEVIDELVAAGCYRLDALRTALKRERRRGRRGVSDLDAALARRDDQHTIALVDLLGTLAPASP